MIKLRRELSEGAGALALLVVPVLCATFLFLLPRATVPAELPSPRLPRTEVEAALSADARLTSHAPHTPTATRLDTLMAEQGRFERVGREPSQLEDARAARLRSTYEALVTEAGEDSAMAVRARAMQRFEDALDLKLPKGDAEAVVGAMSSIFARSGASRDGYLLLPRFAVRTMYKARWNLLCGLRADHRFARVEKLSFYGWEALGVERLPLSQRVQALREYEHVGGRHANEAFGVFAFGADDISQAVVRLDRAYQQTPTLRLRNYVRAARIFLASTGGEPP